MTLKLGPIADDKPVKVALDIPADVYRDLSGPAKLIVPMLVQFMATDRGFAKARRQLGAGG